MVLRVTLTCGGEIACWCVSTCRAKNHPGERQIYTKCQQSSVPPTFFFSPLGSSPSFAPAAFPDAPFSAALAARRGVVSWPSTPAGALAAAEAWVPSSPL
jgi:hypothetical protein